MTNVKAEKEEELDLTKTLLFIFFTLIVTVFIASYMIIPDIRELKISKINTSRSLAVLKGTRERKELLSDKNDALTEKNRKILQALTTPFKENRFYEFSRERLGVFKIDSIKKSVFEEDFIKYDINASANISSPRTLYGYIEELENYENVIEISFPITINAKEDYSLDVKFNIKAYELLSK